MQQMLSLKDLHVIRYSFSNCFIPLIMACYMYSCMETHKKPCSLLLECWCHKEIINFTCKSADHFGCMQVMYRIAESVHGLEGVHQCKCKPVISPIPKRILGADSGTKWETSIVLQVISVMLVNFTITIFSKLEWLDLDTFRFNVYKNVTIEFYILYVYSYSSSLIK